jgi:hypothetical protein
VNNDNTVNNDDELFISMGANEAWEFEAFVIASVGTSAAPDFKFTFAVPAGATIRWVASHQQDTDQNETSLIPVSASGTERTADMGNSAVHVVRVRGFVQTAGTGGNLQFQWAQANANAVFTTVQANSFLKAGKF